MQFSYWERRSFLENTDVLVVGAGIVGLSTAIHLKRFNPKLQILVVDRHPISGGASSRNAGFACFGSVGELLDDCSRQPMDQVLELAAERYRGLVYLRELLGDQALGYDPCGGYELFFSNDQAWKNECFDAIAEFNRQLKGEIGDEIYRPVKVDGISHLESSIFNQYEGSIDTGSLVKSLRMLALSTGVNVLNGVEVMSFKPGIDGVWVELEGGEFRASQIAVCTNGFARELMEDLEVVPARNLVVVTSEIPDLQLRGTFHMDRGYGYFRNVGRRILIGGFRNSALEDEFTSEEGANPAIRNRIEEVLRTHILGGQKPIIEYSWSGIMGLGEEKKPIVKKISDRVYCGVRLGGMGVAIGALTGKRLAEIIVDVPAST